MMALIYFGHNEECVHSHSVLTRINMTILHVFCFVFSSYSYPSVYTYPQKKREKIIHLFFFFLLITSKFILVI